MVRQAIDIAESDGQGAARIRGGVAVRRPARQRALHRSIELAGDTVGDGDIARVLAAAAAIRCATAVPCCIPCRSAIRSTPSAVSANRAACSAQRFGVDMHMVTSDVATVRNLMLAVERSHLAVEALVASPLYGRPLGAGRRRG